MSSVAGFLHERFRITVCLRGITDMLSRRTTLVLLSISLLLALSIVFRGTGQNQSHRTEEEATPVREGVMTWRESELSKIYRHEYEWRKGPKLKSLRTAEDTEVLVAPPSVPTFPGSPTPTTDLIIRQLYCEADAIVTGTIKSKASQLTEDETFTFTTYQMSINQVFKSAVSSPIFPGGSIEVTRPGGAILLDGRVIRVRDESFPRLDVNESYLLFLKLVPSTGSYRAFRRASDFEITGDNFSPVKGSSMIQEFQSGGRMDTLLNLINSASATSCNK